MMPEAWAIRRSIARCVLPVLVGPRTALTRAAKPESCPFMPWSLVCNHPECKRNPDVIMQGQAGLGLLAVVLRAQYSNPLVLQEQRSNRALRVIQHSSEADLRPAEPGIEPKAGTRMKGDNQTRTERLAEQISNAILAGEFAPGARLDEHQLAQRFGVSRTPVREALRQLATSGLIDLRPRRGAVVANLTAEETETMFVAMAEMEASCARLAALRMTPLERRRLEALQEQMGALVREGDPTAYADANQTFHLTIYAGAHNSVIADFTASLRRRVAPFRRAQFRTEGRLPKSWAEHGAVVRAILAGDAGGAHAAMLHHVSLVEDAFEVFTTTTLRAGA
jgi:DNA-binding GntR family transcriptional regulator